MFLVEDLIQVHVTAEHVHLILPDVLQSFSEAT